MFLAWAVSCETYEIRGDGTANVFGAGFDTFYVDRFPAMLELTILVRLLLMEDEQGEIELHLFGPDTVSLGSLEYPVHAEPGSNHRPGYLVSQTEALEVGFPAETAGVYSVEVYTGKGSGEPVPQDRRSSLFVSVREDVPE